MPNTERRRDIRRRCSDPLWWRADEHEEFRVGWLLERSNSGAAFVVRDAWPPSVTDLLEVHVWLAPDDRRPGRGFVVHRVTPIHADMVLVAGRFAPLDDHRPGEKATTELVGVGAAEDHHAGTLACEIEPRPVTADAPASVWQG